MQFWRYWQFMQIRQRIFKCTDNQITHFILDKIMKLLTYYTPFYHQSLQSYLISKTVMFFLAHPIVQEAQLSQRGRAMLCIIEYFAKSLKVSQGHSKWHCWVGRTVPEIFSIKWWCDLEIGSKGPLRSLNVALGVVQGHWKWHRSIDLVWLCKYSFMLYHFQVKWRWITSWP